jgi:hypothetical protein
MRGKTPFLPHTALPVTAIGGPQPERLREVLYPLRSPQAAVPGCSPHRELLRGVRRLLQRRRSLPWFVFLFCTSSTLPAADLFEDQVVPFTKKYCQGCHEPGKAKGGLDLTRYGSERDVTDDFRRWNSIVDFIRRGEMPPEDERQPSILERNAVIAAVETMLVVEANKNAGDPGGILPRRLSNTEYDLSIRDLTGVPIRATAEFPADPAGGEGFDNTGEALGMSPAQLNKYLAAAQTVSQHLVLKPGGFSFAPFPVTSYNERKKLAEQAAIDFYKKHEVKLGSYLEAAWRYRHRKAEEEGTPLENWAAQRGLSGKYLGLVAKTLDEASELSGPLKQLGLMWDALPSPSNGPEVPRRMGDIEQLIGFIQGNLVSREPNLIPGHWAIGHLALRAQVAAARDKFDRGGLRARAVLRPGRIVGRKGDPNLRGTSIFLRVDPAFESQPGGLVTVHRPVFSKSKNLPRTEKDEKEQLVETLRSVLERDAPELAKNLAFGIHPAGGTIGPDSFVVKAPALIEIPLSPEAVTGLNDKQVLLDCELDGQSSPEALIAISAALGEGPDLPYKPGAELLVRAQSEVAREIAASAGNICFTFPNRFVFVDAGRGVTAGFHLVEGFFRDDRPLVEKVISEEAQEEINRLWRELDFITESTETMLRGFVWFERAERHVLQEERFDFLRAEDPLLVGEELLSRFERNYLEKLGVKLVEDAIQPQAPDGQFDLIHGFFDRIRAGLAEHRKTLLQAEEPALNQMGRLAERAFSRPLLPSEAASLRGLYQQLKSQGLGVEDALRGVFTAILMSPEFFYRVPHAPEGHGVYPLSNEDLARRLSYFLWSSLPDAGLLAAARGGALQSEDGLRAQTRRMLKDPKIESFAREFFGQWLRYRDYMEKDPIPMGTFSGYDDALRQAIFEAPTRFIADLILRDQPVSELLRGDSAFVNEVLAKHCGESIATEYRRLSTDPAQWHRVEGLRQAGRGGLLGMPVILAKNSAGPRTSPVKRGFWLAHHLLGQHFPPPPADVPELPKTEKEASKTIRELLADHVADSKCAMCHVHFDGLGLAMEGFDAVGRARSSDQAGRAIVATGKIHGGGEVRGVAGLIDYIEKNRRQDFDRQLCRKFLGYALGRSVLLSDRSLLLEMEKSLQTDGRFSALFETVVLSPQFRQQRGRAFAQQEGGGGR